MPHVFYISGPMSNRPYFNFPAFDEAARVLRDKGYTIVSPHEMDTPEMQAAARRSTTGSMSELPPGESWGTMLGRDVQIIADTCTGIVLLPDWEQSRGARLEVATGLLCDKVFAMFFGGDPIPMTRRYIVERLRF